VINVGDHGHVDRRVRPSDTGHGREAFAGEQDFIADACIHGIERYHGIAAIAAIEVERLDQQHLAAFVAGVLLGGDEFSDHAKLHRVFGESPTVPLDEGLRRMAEWARELGVSDPIRFESVEVLRNMPPSWTAGLTQTA